MQKVAEDAILIRWERASPIRWALSIDLNGVECPSHILGRNVLDRSNSKSKALRWDAAGNVDRSVWLESSE